MKKIINSGNWTYYYNLTFPCYRPMPPSNEAFALVHGRAVMGVERAGFHHYPQAVSYDCFDNIPVEVETEKFLEDFLHRSPFSKLIISFEPNAMWLFIEGFLSQFKGSFISPPWLEMANSCEGYEWSAFLVENNITQKEVSEWKTQVGLYFPRNKLMGNFFYSKEKGLYLP